MEILFFIIPLSLILLSLAIWAFFWAVKSEQFDDLEGPGYSILFEDEKHEKSVIAASAPKNKVQNNQEQKLSE